MNIKRSALYAIVLGVLVVSGQAFAGSSMANISVAVTVTANNCRVNENQDMKIEFGAVQINELTTASATVPVTIACDVIPKGTLSMAIKGIGTSFNTQALETNMPGLGITLTSPSSKMLDLNTFYDVTDTFGLSSKTGTFNIAAHLTSDGKTELAGGEFNASATLVIQVS